MLLFLKVWIEEARYRLFFHDFYRNSYDGAHCRSILGQPSMAPCIAKATFQRRLSIPMTPWRKKHNRLPPRIDCILDMSVFIEDTNTFSCVQLGKRQPLRETRRNGLGWARGGVRLAMMQPWFKWLEPQCKYRSSAIFVWLRCFLS